MRLCASKGAEGMNTSIGEAMSDNFEWVQPGNTALEVMNMLCNTRFRHLPVCDPKGQELLGIVSINDITELVASERSRAIEYYR
jgi:Mg/Co/Ni transporter MgtE